MDGGSGGDAATGGCGAGSATLSGSVDGVTFTPESAAYGLDSTLQTGWLAMAASSNVCTTPADAGVVNGLLFSFSTPLHVAVYTGTGATNTFNANYVGAAGGCLVVAGGTVTITKVDSCGVSGTFDLSWGKTQTTGTFSATPCATAPGACQ